MPATGDVVEVEYFVAYGPTDFSEGRSAAQEVFRSPHEDLAWQMIDHRHGVQGFHPTKGQDYAMRAQGIERLSGWREYAERVPRPARGDFFVVRATCQGRIVS